MTATFETRLFLLCTSLVLVFSGLVSAFAADETAVTDEDYACAAFISAEAVPIIESYEVFLNDYFQADEPTSGQVEEAMDYYRYVEDTLNTVYNKSMSNGGGLFSKQENVTLQFSNQEASYCSFLRDQYLRYAQALLHKQALSSASSKRTFEVVDGLKALNENLSELSEPFLDTFPAIFNQMNNALPCYARQCVYQ